ncbi:MAG: LysR family transcriptional regulator [Bacillota bacterium]|jgi:DNA-binding transcriptional LysR family regulator
MNLLHLKYAAEVAATNSMTKAAENLFTSQPNLSRAIKGLEDNLGIEIFKRTSRGIYPTPKGEEFLGYARKVLEQVDAIEAMYQNGQAIFRQFSISVPRASYISCAFSGFVKRMGPENATEIFYRETDSMHVIDNIVNSDYRLGIVRYQLEQEDSYKELMEEKGLVSELLFEFNYVLLMSERHPLAEKEDVTIADLTPYVEISHADPFVQSLPLSTVRKNQLTDNVSKHIYIFERGGQMDLLAESGDVFMWVSPVPDQLLKRYGLVQKVCRENQKKFRDILVYPKDYSLSALDKTFIDELIKIKRQLV